MYKQVDWSLYNSLFPNYDDYKIPMWKEFKETGSELTINVVVPGYEKESFILYAEDGILFLDIKGKEEDGLHYSIVGRRRSGEYDLDKAKATYNNGILVINVPKINQRKALPRKVIEVQ